MFFFSLTFSLFFFFPNLPPKSFFSQDVGKYVAKILIAFGVVKRDFSSWLINDDGSNGSLLVQMNTLNGQGAGAGSGDREAVVTPLVKIVSEMRDQLRQLATSGAGKKELFDLCDQVRDQLANEGVRLEDRPGTFKHSLLFILVLLCLLGIWYTQVGFDFVQS